MVSFRLVVLESGFKSIFGGLGLGLGLGRICYQVHFQFSLCTFAVFCLGRMTFCQTVIVHTTKDRRYLLNIYLFICC